MSQLEKALKLIRSQDPSHRRKAITYLAKSGDDKALKALAWSYKNDPDPDLRELARKGAAHLKKNTSTTTPTTGSLMQAYQRVKEEEPQPVDSMFSFDDDDDTDDDGYSRYGGEDVGLMFSFDDDDEESYDYNDDSFSASGGPIDYDARRHIKRAMDRHLDDGDDIGALEELAQAIDIDPRSKQDEQAQNIAVAVTGLSGEEAMHVLASPVERARILDQLELEGGGDKAKRKRKNNAEPTWGAALMDVGIYALISFAGVVIVNLLTASRLGTLIIQWTDTPEFRQAMIESGSPETRDLIVQFADPSMLGALGAGLAYTFSSLLGAGLFVIAVHIVGSNMMDGRRPMPAAFSTIFPTYSIFYAIFFAVAIIIVFMLPTSLAAYQEQTFDPIIGVAALLGGGGAVIWGLVFLFVMPAVIGRSQGFGYGKGCLTYIVSMFAYFILACIFQFVLQAFGLMLLANMHLIG